ncbi:glycosyltransferase [Terriglobus saanensis]|uniref:Glycosyl transferase family 2 n=1 Tax=Terriglobus saanensis (strain ATCC BAA-1853 / DSM 23119 / SP1PR4) TaxID=401053 RepID=E8V0D0_TERSS|nr:glycosyltransferase family 2 protein [Terriglobus saanensis]ADV84413.1 glycosyl transferase family 2 [Terriglobus saanensis SP1PR4]
MLALSIAAALCALIPATMFCLNLLEYRTPPPSETCESITLIFPVRNEAAGITSALKHALATTHTTLEIIVLDDHSTDNTAQIVQTLALTHNQIRLIPSAPLPTDWNGKQHACWQGAQHATHDLLCFVDADVRLSPESLPRMAAFLQQTKAELVSGFPLQQTLTPLEYLLLPLIHFILLGLLPMRQMARSTSVAYAAGCGQFLLCRRPSYFATGGHSAIRQTMHDGLLLPRLFRQHGHLTRLADLTNLATCRMYTNTRDTWNGLSKNATEGMATPALLRPLTLLFALGQIFPLPLLAASLYKHNTAATILSATALALSYLPRILGVLRFRHSIKGALLHPLGIGTLLALQWTALIQKARGKTATWKNRTYPAN